MARTIIYDELRLVHDIVYLFNPSSILLYNIRSVIYTV